MLDGARRDVRVRGDLIAEIGADLGRVGGEEEVDAAGGLCTRPFTDAHLHLDKAGTAALARDVGSIEEAIAAMRELKAAAVSAPDALADRMAAEAARLLAAGTRRARIDVDVDETWGLLAFETALQLRERLAGRLDLRAFAFPQDGLSPQVEGLLREAAANGADGIGAHTDVDADPAAHLGAAAAIARAADLPLEVHVDESLDVDRFRLPLVLELAEGVRSLALVHCLTLGRLPDAERTSLIEAIAVRGASVVVAPGLLSFGLPLAPVAELLAAGVPVLIGSDNLRDVFVPVGTGRAFDNLRLVAVSCGLKAPEQLAAIFAGVTDSAFAAVGGCDDASWAPGSPAALQVFAAGEAADVVNGEERLLLDLTHPPEEDV